MLAETDLRLPEQFGAIIIKRGDGYPVRLRDVGRVERGPLDERVSRALQRQAAPSRSASSSRRSPTRWTSPRRARGAAATSTTICPTA